MAQVGTSVNEYYEEFETGYLFPNDTIYGNEKTFAQFNTVITNKIFTPDDSTDENLGLRPEDLQLRVSKGVKYFLGSNDAASNDRYSLSITDSPETSGIVPDATFDATMFNTSKDMMAFSAKNIALKNLVINETLTHLRASTKKILELHSRNHIQTIAPLNAKEEARFDKNIYCGSNLIFESFRPSTTGGLPDQQVRIAMQYNSQMDTLDIVKQQGTGSNVNKRLMARIGQGIATGDDTSLNPVPYFTPAEASSQPYVTDATVLDAINVFSQNGTTLHYGTGLDEHVAIGTSNAVGDEKLVVEGLSRLNSIRVTPDNDVTGIANLEAASVSVLGLVVHSNLTIGSNVGLIMDEPTIGKINFKNNDAVSDFDGNISKLNYDENAWLESTKDYATVSEVPLSLFMDDLGSLSNIDKVPIKQKWRFSESGENLVVQKLNAQTGEWDVKFTFQDA